MSDPNTEQEPTPPAPPVQPYAVAVEKPSAWPTALGIVGVVLASLGLLTGIWGIVGLFLMDVFLGFMPAAQAEAVRAIQDNMMIWSLLISILTTGVAIVLLVASIDLIRRRSRGMRLSLLWAKLRIAQALGTSVIGYISQTRNFELIRQSNPAGFPMGSGFEQFIAIAGIVIGLIWGCALPIFVLIWFSRATIKEEVATWD